MNPELDPARLRASLITQRHAWRSVQSRLGRGPCSGRRPPRDLVQRVAGRDVETIEGVDDALRGHEPGDRVRVVVRRGNQDRGLEVTLGRLPTAASGNGG